MNQTNPILVMNDSAQSSVVDRLAKETALPTPVTDQAPPPSPMSGGALENLLARLRAAKRTGRKPKTRGAFGKCYQNGVRGFKKRPPRIVKPEAEDVTKGNVDQVPSPVVTSG